MPCPPVGAMGPCRYGTVTSAFRGPLEYVPVALRCAHPCAHTSAPREGHCPVPGATGELALAPSTAEAAVLAAHNADARRRVSPAADVRAHGCARPSATGTCSSGPRRVIPGAVPTGRCGQMPSAKKIRGCPGAAGLRRLGARERLDDRSSVPLNPVGTIRTPPVTQMHLLDCGHHARHAKDRFRCC